MVVVKRVTQINEVKIPALISMAKDKGHEDRTAIVKWIISASPYWRSKGYYKIIEEMDGASSKAIDDGNTNQTGA